MSLSASSSAMHPRCLGVGSHRAGYRPRFAGPSAGAAKCAVARRRAGAAPYLVAPFWSRPPLDVERGVAALEPATRATGVFPVIDSLFADQTVPSQATDWTTDCAISTPCDCRVRESSIRSGHHFSSLPNSTMTWRVRTEASSISHL